MSKELRDRYTTAFGDEYGMTFVKRLSKTGSYAAGLFTVETKDGLYSTVTIKISDTIINTWNLSAQNLEAILPWLGVAKIKIALEDSSLKAPKDELAYDSYNSASSYDDECDRLKEELEELVRRHGKWLELERENYLRTSELSSEMGKDYTQFQTENARELRTTLLQIGSVSAAIIAGITALGSDSVRGSLILLLALLLLCVVIGLTFYRIFSILEGQSISIAQWYKKLSGQLDRERKSEADFLLSPSIEKYNSLAELREKETRVVESRVEKEDDVVRKDEFLKWVQILFSIAIALLIISFVNWSSVTNGFTRTYNYIHDTGSMMIERLQSSHQATDSITAPTATTSPL
jgi:hypothetical protein